MSEQSPTSPQDPTAAQNPAATDSRPAPRAGTPCWIDLFTHDIEGAKSFYGELFGWDLTDTGEEFGHYTMATRDGHPVGGLMAAMNPDGSVPDPAEQPTAWTVYLATDDAAATAEAIPAAGGTVLFPPMEVPGLGHMSVAQDPSGAAVGFWQAAPFAGFDKPGTPGTPAWFELMTKDFDAAEPFYRSVFGWDAVRMPSDDDSFRYATDQGGEGATAGLCDASPWLPEQVPSYWRPYIAVEDCDRAAEQVAALGGSVLDGPMDSPFGRVATIADPQGGSLQIIDLSRAQRG